MDAEVLKLAASQGFFAVLFVALLFYVLKENSKRESEYQKIIKEFSRNFECIELCVTEIKTKVDKS